MFSAITAAIVAAVFFLGIFGRNTDKAGAVICTVLGGANFLSSIFLFAEVLK
jgi:hypothetical protein